MQKTERTILFIVFKFHVLINQEKRGKVLRLLFVFYLLFNNSMAKANAMIIAMAAPITV
jgi:hypothetical protein